MNNNQRGNNRRRGRGNNGNRPNNGGQQLNRIDSRARGNAPQLLEKYRKLAQDAHLNGDRVQAEYYLQFADHYFRVSADTRVRQDEQRLRRDEGWRDENGNESAESGGDEGEYSDFPSFDQPSYQSNQQRAPRPDDRPRDERPRRDDRPQQSYEPGPRAEAHEVQAETGEEDAQAGAYEPAENPFVRDSRGTRGLRPRRDDRRPRDDDVGEQAPAGFDPALLPPAIARADDEVTEEAPKPRRGRPRKPRPDDEALETVG